MEVNELEDVRRVGRGVAGLVEAAYWLDDVPVAMLARIIILMILIL